MNQQDATNLLDHGPTLAQCQAMTFQALMQFIRDAGCIERLKTCMQQLTGEEPTEPKHFMTSYMIAAFPTHVFDTIGPVENELTTAAREFIAQLESIAGDARNGNPVDAQAIEGFRATAADFHAKFNTWRVADRERLTAVLATQVVALITAKIALPADAPEHAQVDRGIALIKNKLRAIGSNPEVLRAALAVAFPGFPGFANV